MIYNNMHVCFAFHLQSEEIQDEVDLTADADQFPVDLEEALDKEDVDYEPYEDENTEDEW